MDGYMPKRISTPSVETQIALLSTSSEIDLTGFRLFGRTFILVQTGGPSTFVYSVEDNIWHEWTSTYRLWYKMAGNTSTTNAIYSISRDLNSGKVYVISPSNMVYTDDGSSFTMQIR